MAMGTHMRALTVLNSAAAKVIGEPLAHLMTFTKDMF